MLRTKLIIDGEVQRVDYRALVKYIAMNLGIKGLVRNLRDGRVEIECEAKNKETLEKFMNLINIKREKDELFVPDVKNIQLIFEEEVEKCSFKEFRIDYETEDIRRTKKEMIERSEIAILAFGEMGRRVGGKIDVGFERLGNELKEFGKRTDDNFKTMENKYGTISETLNKLNNNFNILIKILIIYLSKNLSLKKTLKNLWKVVEEFASFTPYKNFD